MNVVESYKKKLTSPDVKATILEYLGKRAKNVLNR